MAPLAALELPKGQGGSLNPSSVCSIPALAVGVSGWQRWEKPREKLLQALWLQIKAQLPAWELPRDLGHLLCLHFLPLISALSTLTAKNLVSS